MRFDGGQGALEERSTPELIRSIAADGGELIRKELELARQEMIEGLGARARAGAVLAVAGASALVGAIFVATAAAWALAIVLPIWAAFGIVAGVMLAMAGGAAFVGLGLMRRAPAPPRETVRTIKEGMGWARTQLRR